MKKGYKYTRKKKAKPAHPIKSCAHSYNIEICNSFNLELQLKNTEFAIKRKLKKNVESVGSLYITR